MRPRMFVARCCCGAISTPSSPVLMEYGNWTPGGTFYETATMTRQIPDHTQIPAGIAFGNCYSITLSLTPTIYHGFLYFEMSPIPQGSTISSASLWINAQTNNLLVGDVPDGSHTEIGHKVTAGGSGSARCRIYGADEDSSTHPQNAAELDAKSLTTAFVDYDVAKATYVSPLPVGGFLTERVDHHQIYIGDMQPIVQEIVNRPGWTGTKLLLLFTEHGSDASCGAILRPAYLSAGDPTTYVTPAIPPGWTSFEVNFSVVYS